MYIALISVILFLCVLLVLVVLSQNSKGGGLSSQFGGGGTSQLMGVKRTGDLLEKLTWGFAIGIIVLTLCSHMIVSDGGAEVRSVNEQRAGQAPAPAPAAPAIPQQGPGATAPAQTPAAAPATDTAQ
ncbi:MULTISPECIES: preprotein translocase subunit SecG [Rufibacter]|uniref:Protein-export membrane protein SecG n=1 Tax=Rufibacter quisquiliarum TaxID=1549639 RepID=A0A839GW79_9BACT|nr:MULTISPECIES: preprotein translocase subunit SecG [Rufibacter]MBA9078678.1 preprotein translocase subunit SecG [Rufibacter quisquiliarum]